jgi:hypothetical protein
MTTDRANASIVTALGVSGALVLVKAGAAGQVPKPRAFIGITFAGVALSVLAQSAPQVAGPVALLLMTTAVFVYGGPAWTAISRATGGPTNSSPVGGIKA